MHSAFPLLLAQYSAPQAPGTGTSLAYLALVALALAGWWKIFVKAGKPGWAALIPIYNLIVMLEIAGRPIWWVVLFIIPVVNLVILVLVCIELVGRFGKSPLFGLGLALLGFIFAPMLGFGDATYRGGPTTGGADPLRRGAA